MNPTQLAELVEFGEAEAYVDMMAAAPPEWGLRADRIGSAIALIAPPIDILLFNRVIGSGVLEPATEMMIDVMIDRYRQVNIHHFGFQLSPSARPSALPDWLAARRIVKTDHWAKVYRAADRSIDVPTDLRVEPLGFDHAASFAQVALTAFDMPPFMQPWLMNLVGRTHWHVYAAFEGDQLAAVGALFVRDHIGWLGVAGTLPSHRRRGAQGALMARRIRDAAALGCDWVITETGEDTPQQPNPSFHNMLRTGFELAYQRANYVK
jgi:GNAT superfamily N-acetyltransferase